MAVCCATTICCATRHAFSVAYHRTTVLRLFLVLVLIQIVSVLNVYMSTTECSPSMIMALANKNLEEADAKQTDCILEIRTVGCWKNY
jgi:hypothetical protein